MHTNAVVLPLLAACCLGSAAAHAHPGGHHHGHHHGHDPHAHAPGARTLPALADDQPTAVVPGAFTVVGLPDTQNYTESFPLIFSGQIDWILDSRDDFNIAFVSHFGDVVQHGTGSGGMPDSRAIAEYDTAVAALTPLLVSDIPFGIASGNHDVLESGVPTQTYDDTLFFDNFGPALFAGRPWSLGTSPSGISNAALYAAGGREWVVVSLSVDNPLPELVWAAGILTQHRDKPAMISTHRYLQDADAYIPSALQGLGIESGRYPDVWYIAEGLYDDTGTRAEEFWRSFVRTNRNIYWVNCGHFHEQYRQSSNNFWGLPVREVLADYQDDPNGGNGWLRLMEHDTELAEVRVRTYSPELGKFIEFAMPGETTLTPAEGVFTYAVDFDAHAPRGSRSFQQGIAGYTGTLDTWISEASANTAYASGPELTIDDDTENSFFSDDRGIALVRFEDVFTTTDEPGKVPTGAHILGATLRVALTDDIDGLFDVGIDVYRANLAWNASSTWNSLGDGIQAGELSTYFGRIEGDNDPNSDGFRVIDVTSAVQAWADGAPNFGFVLAPQIVTGNDDGMNIAASEFANPLYRPALDVVYFIPEPCGPADINADGSLNNTDINLYVGLFLAGDLQADLTGDGSINNTDINLFVSLFLAGCP